MKKAIIGKKVGMTQVFMENGECIPVTVILAGPCAVVAKKTIARDGYSSAVVGFDAIPQSRTWSIQESKLSSNENIERI